MKSIRLTYLVGLTALCASAAQAQIDILPVTFTCTGGVRLPVTYFNPAEGDGAAAMVVDGQLIALRQVPSGSGIRYESVGGQGTYVLRSKGWDAVVSFAAAGGGGETDVLTGCTSR
ncbi:Membrane-bound lysozyme-inhibitor of c-type lysozyme [Ruegeria intermedia]|uniref:Membrane-bound lysozyme-inhibitor of c-type lysozyme n=1 Tax=Ruegeria intermedia TaxID=996115 RepID=A0A1M4VIW6_9RHOB|nr:MliC family protein [Ruegeria intermedia]SHE68898.1 Membrane-bound lysozyme-inhibitor of c-type lysozyme [Ruegeria intermedia]